MRRGSGHRCADGRSTGNSHSEALNWASWDVKDLVGKKAQIKIVDMNTARWSHLVADRSTAAETPAMSVVQRADWAGRQGLLRGGVLGERDGRQEVRDRPDEQVGLRRGHPHIPLARRTERSLTTKPLIGSAAKGKALDVEATVSLKGAACSGLKVRTGAGGEETVIGYNATTQELYIDRTRSGAVDFNSTFPGVQAAPLKAWNGKFKLRILVDWSSVEVLGGSGEAVITDQFFPDLASQGVQVFAENGSVKLGKALVRHLDSARD
jgi:fructan beta-fructosidase